MDAILTLSSIGAISEQHLEYCCLIDFMNPRNTPEKWNSKYGCLDLDEQLPDKECLARSRVAWRQDGDSVTEPRADCSCQCVRHAVTDFTRHSTLHGLRYTVDQSISRLERFFWVVSFIAASAFAINFITNVYYKWNNSPVILSLSPEATVLSAIPFPAVTICNMNNAKRSIALEMLNRAQSAGKEGSKERKMLNDFCKRPQVPEDGNIDESDIDWTDLRALMVNVSQPCHEMLVSCFWHSERYSCDDLFNPTLTDEGICCSFNKVKRDFMFHNPTDLSDLNVTFPFESNDWTPERGFPQGGNIDFLPWRAWGAGSHLGLTIVLDANLDEYYCSSEVSIGFKMHLHNSVESPKMNAFATLIAPGLESRVVVDPTLWSTTQQFRTIPARKRNCVFGEEKNLSFYRTYTQRNCALECEAKFTIEACNCVLYYMPKNASTRICSRRDEGCAKRALKAMELRLIDDGNISASLNTTKTKPCGCKPGCFAISYQMKTTTSKLSRTYNAQNEFLGTKDAEYFSKNMAVVHVFFTETQYTSRQRGELFGFTELLSNTGGLLGLFLGFSFLSAVEALYFLTLRLWCSFHRHRNQTAPSTHKFVKGKTPFPFTQ